MLQIQLLLIDQIVRLPLHLLLVQKLVKLLKSHGLNFSLIMNKSIELRKLSNPAIAVHAKRATAITHHPLAAHLFRHPTHL